MASEARGWRLKALCGGILALLPLAALPLASPPLALAWAALAAPPAGALAAGLGPWALVAALGSVVGGLTWATPALLGLFAGGIGLARIVPVAELALAARLWLAGALLAGAPSLGGLAGPAPWSPALTAHLLDLSSVVLVVECAGVDWMRHPAVYGPAGGDSIGPDLRLPWRGPLAGGVTFLVGCALLALSLRRRSPMPL